MTRIPARSAQIIALVDALTGPTVDTEDAKRPEALGGVPDTAGLYSWWVRPGALPGVSGPNHPREPRQLLYVGIAPSRPTSSATLRKRVVGAHLGGNIGASTFRMSLTALLVGSEGWRPFWKKDRPLLSVGDNRKLSAWQAANLRVCWSARPEPWAVEAPVIDALHAPLNLADNLGHPFHRTLSAAREALRAESKRNAVR